MITDDQITAAMAAAKSGPSDGADAFVEGVRFAELAVAERLREALFAAEDALDTLRRGHGVEVSTLCYPALNLVRDACTLIRGLSQDYP